MDIVVSGAAILKGAIAPKKFRDKRTGEIVERFSILEIRHFEPVKEEKEGVSDE